MRHAIQRSKTKESLSDATNLAACAMKRATKACDAHVCKECRLAIKDSHHRCNLYLGKQSAERSRVGLGLFVIKRPALVAQANLTAWKATAGAIAQKKQNLNCPVPRSGSAAQT